MLALFSRWIADPPMPVPMARDTSIRSKRGHSPYVRTGEQRKSQGGSREDTGGNIERTIVGSGQHSHSTA
jgi:hypothetical protein